MMPMNFSGHYDHWWCGPGFFFPGPIGMFLSLLFWVLIIYLVAKVVQTIFRPKPLSSPSSLDILKKRYANGDIDEATYRKMKKELTSDS